MTEKPAKGSLLVIFLTVFIDLLGFGMVLPLLPIYAQEFTADPAGVKLGLLMASFSAMQFIFAPLWGRLSDRIGRRPVIIVGLSGSVIFYSLFAFATVEKSLALLFVSRIGAGIAGATISTAQAYIADTTSLQNRSRGMALIGMAFGLGFTFGPLLGYLAVPTGTGAPGPGPGIAAAALSLFALALAVVQLPESLGKSNDKRVAERSGVWDAIRIPSMTALLATVAVCVFSFANFETTLSLLIKPHENAGPFQFSFRQVCLTFAYIGFVSALVQGGIVRRLSGRVPEGIVATTGAVVQIAGFFWIVISLKQTSAVSFLLALGFVVSGFALLTPSLNSLISRRADPAKQGVVLGVSQSVSSLARIVGSGLGIPLLRANTLMPFFSAAALMCLGLVLVIWADRQGADFQSTSD